MGALSVGAGREAEARFTAEASRIAGRRVRIRCDEGYAFTGAGSDTLGIAFPGARLAYLDPTICRTLYDLAFRGDRRGREQTADALIVLAHEAVHLGGERREGVTECLALQEAVPSPFASASGKGRRAVSSGPHTNSGSRSEA